MYILVRLCCPQQCIYNIYKRIKRVLQLYGFTNILNMFQNILHFVFVVFGENTKACCLLFLAQIND